MIDTLGSLYTSLVTKSLVKTKSTIFLIRNDDKYYKEESDWKKVLEATSFKGNIVIVLYSYVDKINKFVKEHDAVLTRFDFMTGSILKIRKIDYMLYLKLNSNTIL